MPLNEAQGLTHPEPCCARPTLCYAMLAQANLTSLATGNTYQTKRSRIQDVMSPYVMHRANRMPRNARQFWPGDLSTLCYAMLAYAATLRMKTNPMLCYACVCWPNLQMASNGCIMTQTHSRVINSDCAKLISMH